MPVLFLLVNPSFSLTVPTVTLPGEVGGGAKMPIVGIGTGGYGSNFRDHAYQFVLQWLQLGGPRIDTALSYGDQSTIAKAITDSKVGRENVFVTSKMPSEGYNQTFSNMDKILSELSSTYVDLTLIHAPSKDMDTNIATWKALVALQQAGKSKAVGVSNFCVNHLEALKSAGLPTPAVNQFEFQPYWHADTLTKYCRDNNIQLNNAAPMGGPDVAPKRNHWNCSVPELPVIVNMAKEKSCTPGQIILAWEYTYNGFVVNPRTNHSQHMKDNLGGWWDSVKLTDTEVATMADLKNHLPSGATSGKVYHAGFCD